MKTILDRDDYLNAKCLQELSDSQHKEVIDALGKYALDYYLIKMKKHNTIELVLRILLRILGVLPFGMLSLFAFAVMFVRFMIYYILYGGISIAYTKFNEYKTINDLYHEVSSKIGDKNTQEIN